MPKEDYCKRLAYWILTVRRVRPVQDLLDYTNAEAWELIESRTEEELAKDLFSEVTESWALYAALQWGVYLTDADQVLAQLGLQRADLHKLRYTPVQIPQHLWNDMVAYCASGPKGFVKLDFPCWPTPRPPLSIWDHLVED